MKVSQVIECLSLILEAHGDLHCVLNTLHNSKEEVYDVISRFDDEEHQWLAEINGSDK